MLFRKLTKRQRRLLLLAFAALLVLIIGPYIVSRARSAGRQIRVFSEATAVPAERVSTVRLLAYNIAHGRGATDDNWEGTVEEKKERIEEIAQLIVRSEADVVVLNEVDFCSTWSGHQNQAEAIARLTGFQHRVEQRSLDFRFIYGSWKFGNVILSRYPITDAEIVKYPALSGWEELLAGCKQGVVCKLQLSQSQQVRLLAVHLEYRSEDVRVSSAQRIVDLSKSSDVPIIAAGDFNSTPSDLPNAERSATGKNAMDVIEASRQFQRCANTFATQNEMTFSSMRPTRVIDWILVPNGWSFGEYLIVPSQLSDHRPVIATIEIPIED